MHRACVVGLFSQTVGFLRKVHVQRQDQTIFAPASGRVVPVAAANDTHPDPPVQRERADVGGPYLQEHPPRTGAGGALEHLAEEPTRVTATPSRRHHTEVQDMRFAGGDRNDAVTDQTRTVLKHKALVPGIQTVCKDAFGPGKLISGRIVTRDLRDIGSRHRPNACRRRAGGAITPGGDG